MQLTSLNSRFALWAQLATVLRGKALWTGFILLPILAFAQTAPNISQQPQSQTVLIGSNATFAVTATAADPLSYVWYKDGSPISSATNSAFTVSTAQSFNVGSYTVVVSATGGSVTSDVATLNVKTQPDLLLNVDFADYNPALVGASSPKSGPAAVGQTGQDFWGFFPYGRDMLNYFYPVKNNGETIMFFTPLADGSDSHVTITLTNALGSGTNGASDPMYRTFLCSTNGSETTLLCYGMPPGVYDFYVYGHEPSDIASSIYELEVNGNHYGPSTNLSTNWNSTVWQEGAQYVAFRGVYVTSSSSGAYIHARTNTTQRAVIGGLQIAQFWQQPMPPVFWENPQVGSRVVDLECKMYCNAKGSGTISYQWYHQGAPVTNDSRISGSTTHVLTFTNLTTNDHGNYSVVASNAVGTTTSSEAFLDTLDLPYIVSQPASQTVRVGSQVVWPVVVSGPGPMTYFWFNQTYDSYIYDGGGVSGSQTSTLTLSNVQPSTSGSYMLTAYNNYGANHAYVNLTVADPPAVTNNPVSRSVPLGLPTAFSASGTGTPPLSYQWRFNGADIPKATSTTYSISSINLTNLGSYTLVISNIAGTATSGDGVLTLGPVACWGLNNKGNCLPPAGLSNVVSVAAANTYSAALLGNGSITSWGGTLQLPDAVKTNACVAVAVNSSDTGVALRADGTCYGWNRTVPTSISNVIAVACGTQGNLFLRSDGTVVGDSPITYPIPPGLTKVTAIAAGTYQACALRSDGTVVAWRSQVAARGATNVPAGLTNVMAIACGTEHCMALLSNRTVVVWGANSLLTNVPKFLTNATVIAAGGASSGLGNSLANNYFYSNVFISYPAIRLTNMIDNYLAAWGDNSSNQLSIPFAITNFSNVGLAVGAYHGLSLSYPTQFLASNSLIIHQPVGGTAFSGRDFRLSAQIIGHFVGSYWTFNGAPISVMNSTSNAVFVITNAQPTDAGMYQLVVLQDGGAAPVLSVPVPVNVADRAPFLNVPPVDRTTYVGNTVNLGVPVSGSGPMTIQWRFNGQDIAGATNEDLVFAPVGVSDAGTYSFVASNAFGSVTSTNVVLTVRQVVVWGANSYGQTNVPVSLTNAIAICGGNYYNAIALRDDGTVVMWGGTTNIAPGFSNVVEIAYPHGMSSSVGGLHGLRANGTVCCSREYVPYYSAVELLSNIVAIEVDNWGSTYLKPDGSILRLTTSGTTNVINVSNVVAVSRSGDGFQLIRADGWIFGYYDGYPLPTTPDFVAVAGDRSANTLLRRDQTIVDFGHNPVAPFTNNFVAVASTYAGTALGVRADGGVFAWGTGTSATNIPSGLPRLRMIDGNYDGFIALCTPPDFDPISLAAALNTSNIVVSSRNSPQWYTQHAFAHDGVNAARSAALGQNTASSMRTLVTNGPVTVSFWWKVSSETNHDFLTFSIGGLPQAAISGEVDWQQVSFVVPAGPQMLVWTYSKDNAGSSGVDAGFVDQLTFTPIAPTISSQPVDTTAIGGTSVTLPVSATGTTPLAFRWLSTTSTNIVSTSSALTFFPAHRTNTATYYVIVSNMVGTIQSSNAALTVRVPQRISMPLLQPDGTVLFSTQDFDGRPFAASFDPSVLQVQYSSNLVDWSPLTMPLTLTNGSAQLYDPASTNMLLRFYRIIEPW